MMNYFALHVRARRWRGVSGGTRFAAILLMNVATIFFVVSSNAEDRAAQLKSADEVAAIIEADALQRIRGVSSQYEQLMNTPKPSGHKHCRWNDPEVTKKDMPFYLSEYERAVLSCSKQWAPQTQTVWIGLNKTKNSIHKNDYEAALDILRGSRYQESAPNSAVRDLTDKVIDLFESGASKTHTMNESYFACIAWAELDPKQIMNGREYKRLSKAQLAIGKGLLVCD